MHYQQLQREQPFIFCDAHVYYSQTVPRHLLFITVVFTINSLLTAINSLQVILKSTHQPDQKSTMTQAVKITVIQNTANNQYKKVRINVQSQLQNENPSQQPASNHRIIIFCTWE